MERVKVQAVLLSLLNALPLLAQGTQADYDRATRLRQTVQNKVFGERVEAHWFHGNDRFWYVRELARGERQFVVVDATTGQKRPAFDHAKMAADIAATLGAEFSPTNLPIQSLEFRDDGELRLRVRGKVYGARDYKLTLLPGESIAEKALPRLRRLRASGSGGERTTVTFVNRTDKEIKVIWVDTESARHEYAAVAVGDTYTQNTYSGHVWLVTDSTGKELGVWQAESDPGTAIVDGKPFAGATRPPAPRPTGESPNGKSKALIRDHNLWVSRGGTEPVQLTKDGTQQDGYRGTPLWSPDGQSLVALKTKTGQDHKVYLIDSSPQDQVQPKLRTLDYRKPGDEIDRPVPHLFDVAAGKEIPIDETLFANPWEIDDIRWEADGKRFTFVYNQRGHQALRVIAVEAETGRATAIVTEESRTFIDYAGKFFIHYLSGAKEILWMSERDGWNHLYLYDALTGRVKNQVTKGEWVVRGVDRVDEQARQVWFRLGGYYRGHDPYEVHYARINLDGTGLTMLTQAKGHHRITMSPDGRYYMDSHSQVDRPAVTELHRVSDGAKVCDLERADASALLATGWKTPEPFVAKGRDGKTDIHGVIYRPSNFDPSRKYPVIETIYAGPQAAYVPKEFAPVHGGMEFAELGFIVVQIDGMGTSFRSKAFHDLCWKNLADAGFPDRILWMQAAAKKYPYMDISRVGIYGGSAGGQNALGGLLTHAEFYKVGIADCGCHDNRMDKIWWNELWMGWPIGPHYAEQSNVTLAPNLRGKLLLLVGEVDSNVDPASTMQVANALIKANKEFDFLMVPGAGHGVMGIPYVWRKAADFFVRNLLGVEPRAIP